MRPAVSFASGGTAATARNSRTASSRSSSRTITSLRIASIARSVRSGRVSLRGNLVERLAPLTLAQRALRNHIRSDYEAPTGATRARRRQRALISTEDVGSYG